MKQTFLFALALAFALAACNAPTPAPTPTANVGAILTATAPQKPGSPAAPSVAPFSSKALIVAHRGGAALMPENTLAAFENALKLGVDQVETDTHLSKDGEVIIMHDPNVATTTNGSGQISDMTLAELKKLNAAAKNAKGGVTQQEIPTLAQVLDMVKGKSGIQIEIKVNAGNTRYPGIEKKVIDLVNARGMTNDAIIISFDFPTLKQVKALDARIKTGAIVDARWFTTRATLTPDQIVAEIIETTGADFFMPNSTPVTEALVRAVHARGLKIGTWTVNSAGEMKRLADWGVDGITTNNPDVLKSVLGR
ncbi:MAG: glycerophosphodiester phosphodiesterase [Chloroflexi bacterium]|nr:glycerophosphodiester phosphodiesterase [Chloroflexota bacterium]